MIKNNKVFIATSLDGYIADVNGEIDWLHSLPTAMPVRGDYRISSGFGIRNDPFTGGLAMHEGLDFTAPTGTLVVSTAQGTVTRSGWDPGYGNVVEIRHAEDFLTRYAHLHKRSVVTDMQVSTASVLGEVGSTGSRRACRGSKARDAGQSPRG